MGFFFNSDLRKDTAISRQKKQFLFKEKRVEVSKMGALRRTGVLTDENYQTFESHFFKVQIFQNIVLQESDLTGSSVWH